MELTPEQKAQQAKRTRRGAAMAQGGGKAEAASPAGAVSFHTLAVIGSPIQIGSEAVVVTEFPLSKVPEAGRLLNGCPFVLVSHVRANKDFDDFDAGRTADLINRSEKPEAGKEASAAEVLEMLSVVGSQLTEAEVASMVDLILLNAQRRSPQVTREGLDDGMTIPVFLNALRLLIRENPNLADPF